MATARLQEANALIQQSIITCPNCAAEKPETMPTDACQFFYKCTGCSKILRPKPGDCCVFCSYGSVPCPSIQQARLVAGEPLTAFGEQLEQP